MAATTEVASPHAFTALAVVSSLMEALIKRGLIDKPAVDDILRDAASYAQALCADCSSDVDREVQRLLESIGQAEVQVAVAEAPPTPVVDPGEVER